MKYLEHELDVIEWLESCESREILADYLKNEAPLGEIEELVNIINNALLYRKQKDKKK